MSVTNWASHHLGAQLIGYSSQVEGCEASHILSPKLSQLWLSQHDHVPQWICVSLVQLKGGEDVCIRTIGWYCWHAYATNPKTVTVHISGDGAKYKIWDTFHVMPNDNINDGINGNDDGIDGNVDGNVNGEVRHQYNRNHNREPAAAAVSHSADSLKDTIKDRDAHDDDNDRIDGDNDRSNPTMKKEGVAGSKRKSKTVGGKGIHLFCCAPISTAIYPFIALEIVETFGSSGRANTNNDSGNSSSNRSGIGMQTYMNRLYMFSEEILASSLNDISLAEVENPVKLASSLSPAIPSRDDQRVDLTGNDSILVSLANGFDDLSLRSIGSRSLDDDLSLASDERDLDGNNDNEIDHLDNRKFDDDSDRSIHLNSPRNFHGADQSVSIFQSPLHSNSPQIKSRTPGSVSSSPSKSFFITAISSSSSVSTEQSDDAVDRDSNISIDDQLSSLLFAHEMPRVGITENSFDADLEDIQMQKQIFEDIPSPQPGWADKSRTARLALKFPSEKAIGTRGHERQDKNQVRSNIPNSRVVKEEVSIRRFQSSAAADTAALGLQSTRKGKSPSRSPMNQTSTNRQLADSASRNKYSSRLGGGSATGRRTNNGNSRSNSRVRSSSKPPAIVSELETRHEPKVDKLLPVVGPLQLSSGHHRQNKRDVGLNQSPESRRDSPRVAEDAADSTLPRDFPSYQVDKSSMVIASREDKQDDYFQAESKFSDVRTSRSQQDKRAVEYDSTPEVKRAGINRQFDLKCNAQELEFKSATHVKHSQLAKDIEHPKCERTDEYDDVIHLSSEEDVPEEKTASKTAVLTEHLPESNFAINQTKAHSLIAKSPISARSTQVLSPSNYSSPTATIRDYTRTPTVVVRRASDSVTDAATQTAEIIVNGGSIYETTPNLSEGSPTSRSTVSSSTDGSLSNTRIKIVPISDSDRLAKGVGDLDDFPRPGAMTEHSPNHRILLSSATSNISALTSGSKTILSAGSTTVVGDVKRSITDGASISSDILAAGESGDRVPGSLLTPSRLTTAWGPRPGDQEFVESTGSKSHGSLSTISANQPSIPFNTPSQSSMTPSSNGTPSLNSASYGNAGGNTSRLHWSQFLARTLMHPDELSRQNYADRNSSVRSEPVFTQADISTSSNPSGPAILSEIEPKDIEETPKERSAAIIPTEIETKSPVSEAVIDGRERIDSDSLSTGISQTRSAESADSSTFNLGALESTSRRSPTGNEVTGNHETRRISSSTLDSTTSRRLATAPLNINRYPIQAHDKPVPLSVLRERYLGTFASNIPPISESSRSTSITHRANVRTSDIDDVEGSSSADVNRLHGHRRSDVNSSPRRYLEATHRDEFSGLGSFDNRLEAPLFAQRARTYATRNKESLASKEPSSSGGHSRYEPKLEPGYSNNQHDAMDFCDNYGDDADSIDEVTRIAKQLHAKILQRQVRAAQLSLHRLSGAAAIK